MTTFLLLYPLERHTKRPTAAAALLLAFIGLLPVSACRPAATPKDENKQSAITTEGSPAGGASGSRSDAVGISPAGNDLPPSSRLLEEAWYTIYIQGQKVGHRHTQTYELERDGRHYTRYQSAEQIAIIRFGTPVESRTMRYCEHDADGNLVRYAYELPLGSGLTRVEGRIAGGQRIEQTIVGNRQRQSAAPYHSEVGGLFAVEQSLLEDPLEAGEQRKITLLQSPPLKPEGTLALTADDYEATALPAGEIRLLRIDAEAELAGGGSLPWVFWTDGEGNIVKDRVEVAPQFVVESYRAPREVALATPSQSEFDIGYDITVPLENPLPDAHQIRRAGYEVHLEQGNPAEAFIDGGNQSIKQVDKHTAHLEVQAVRLSDSTMGAGQGAPQEADRRSTEFVDSSDPLVQKLAQSVAAGKGEPAVIAGALERLVAEHVTEKSYTQMFGRASEVARSREGDCTEHAVLLAALCRARGIPARVAMGLVHSEAAGGFAYHMWTECWLGGRWMPLDATLGQGGIGAAHLKLGHSSLDGAAAIGSLLPSLRVVGGLSIRVLAVE